MSRQVRHVATLAFVLFAALFVNLNYLQVIQASELSSDNRNVRELFREYDIRRGSIVAGEGEQAEEVARSAETEGTLRFRRVYEPGELYAHVTGFYSFIFGRTELEQSFNDFLTGSAPEVFARNLADLLAGRQRTGDTLRTTIDPRVQRAAAEALGNQIGAVVAIEPATGAVLALWSSPSYDPNALASHDPEEVREAWTQLQEAPGNPLLNRGVREWFPPGSTFKLVTAAAALEAGVRPDDTYPDPERLRLPATASASIGNFGGGLCNGGQPITLAQALEVSCNTTFAQLGLDLGAERLVEQAERFGLNREYESQFADLLPSRIPTELDEPATAQSAIGQRDVRVTPLQMAMIAGAIGNDGVLMTPRVVQQVEDFAGRIIAQYPPEPLDLAGNPNAQAVSRETAATLRDMMVQVVESGTGRAAALDGVEVAGKTGTAQVGEGRPPTVWFTGFAPADQPQVAVAVVIAEGGDVGDEATGGALAAPIAAAVMQTALDSGR